MKLVNAQEMAKKYPETFEAPTQEDLNLVNVGDFVKLCFNDRERMWVQVTYRNGDKLKGTLANDPILIKDLKYGDLIDFKLENIYTLEK